MKRAAAFGAALFLLCLVAPPLQAQCGRFHLTSPGPDAVGVSINTTFTWERSDGAEYYHVYISSKEGEPRETDPEPDKVPVSEFTPETPLDRRTRYFWAVDAICGGKPTPNENGTHSFETRVCEAGRFDARAPRDGEENVPTSVKFQWSQSVGAASYVVYWGTKPATQPEEWEFNAPTRDLAFAPENLAQKTRYFWTVYAQPDCESRDRTRMSGGDNGTLSFLTACEAPGDFKLESPGTGETGLPIDVTLRWQMSANAGSYTVWWGTSDPPQNNRSVDGATTFFNPGPLEYGTKYFWYVEAHASCDSSLKKPNFGGTSYFTTMTCDPAGDFRLIAPTNGQVDVATTTTLQWGVSSGAVSYDVYFGSTTPAPFYQNVTVTAVDVGPLEPGARYYWSVQAVSSCKDAKKTPNLDGEYIFKTECGAPGKFALREPAHGAEGLPLDVVFTWDASEGAGSYFVRWGTSERFENQARTEKPSFSPANLQPGTKYYWTVEAEASCDPAKRTPAADGTRAFITQGSCSPPGPFSLTSPRHGEEAVRLDVTLTWEPASGASHYLVYFGESGTEPATYKVEGTSFTPANYLQLKRETKYIWWVEAVASCDANQKTLNNGDRHAFVTVPECKPPGEFALQLPRLGETDVKPDVTLTWGPSAGAASYNVYIGIFTATENRFSVTGTSFTPATSRMGPLKSGTTYSWFVEAVSSCDANVTTVNNTGTQSFTVASECAPPPRFDLRSPTLGQTGLPRDVLLQWSASDGAGAYTVYFGQTNPPAQSVTVTTTSLRPHEVFGELAAGTKYFWYVEALASCDRNVRTPNNGGVFNFVTAGVCSAPGAFELANPANGATEVGTLTRLSWAPSEGAGSYIVHIGTTDPPSPVNDHVVTDTFFTPANSRLGALSPGTKYYWSVEAVAACDASKRTRNSSGQRSFVTANECNLPGLFSLTAPRAGEQGVKRTATLSWTPASGAGSYIVRYGIDRKFDNEQVVKETSFTPANSALGPLKPAQTYYWSVEAVAACDPTFRTPNSGGIQHFVTEPEPCSPPTISPQASTKSTEAIVNTTVAVEWVTSETPDYFVVEIATDASFRQIKSFKVENNQRAATFTFPQAGTFYVRVVAEKSCGRKEGNVLVFTVTTEPHVAVTVAPSGLVQLPGGTATDSYTLANFGGAPTSIQLRQNGSFFTQSPAQFDLAPGATQVVTLTASGQPNGTYEGESLPTGAGVPEGFVVRVTLVATARPTGNPLAEAAQSRVDVFAPENQEPDGTVTFVNRGDGPVIGTLISDSPWLKVVDEFANIAPGQSATFRFHVDRDLRSGNDGSTAGQIALVYLEGSSSKLGATEATSNHTSSATKSTVVSIRDTVTPPTSTSTIPPVAAGEVAFFVPGVGRFNAAGNQMISDLAVLNAADVAGISNLRIFYSTDAGPSQNVTFSNLSSNQTLQISDVAKSVFGTDGKIGSVQIRAEALTPLAISARLVSSQFGGTFGRSLPVFRSDRGIIGADKLFLAGLRRDSSTRTDFYVQEMSGQAGSAMVQFLNEQGAAISQRNVTITPFAVVQVTDAVPAGAVAAVISSTNAGSRLQAYATPTDLVSGDSWTVIDNSTAHGYDRGTPVIIPIVGRTQGRNNTPFRSDLTVMNTGTSTMSVILRYYAMNRAPVERSISLAAQETRTFTDVVSSLFGLNTQALGYVVVIPSGSGTLAVTSRAYSFKSSGSTFSSFIPALPLSGALTEGQPKKIGGIEDSSWNTVAAAKPETYRTNFGLIETAGEPVKVKVTLRFTAARGNVSAVGVSSREFTMAPREFVMMNSISTAVLRERRADFGDLRDIQADFEVVEGRGKPLVFVTTTENATNDTIYRDQ